jgi:superfamily II DNA/RNA helicase
VWTNRQTLLFSATLGFSQGGVSVKSSTGKGGRVSVKGKSRSDEAGQRAYLRSLVQAAGGAQALSKKQLRRLEQQARRMRGVDTLLLSAGVSSKPLVLRVARASEPSVAALLEAEAKDGIKSSKGGDGALEWGTAGERLVESVPSQPWMRHPGSASDSAGDGGGETMVIMRGRAAVESGGIASATPAAPAAAAGRDKGRSSSSASAAEAAASSSSSASASAAALRLADAGASIALPRGLRLQRVLCAEKERDTRLYWVLSLVQGRAIVFVNSIVAVRSVTALLLALGIPAQPVHAKMQQRQRLKQLDRFKAQPMGVLVATDVAARGLDVEGVAAVIHYHVPRQADIFVHRSGRTARAGQAGIAITLVTPGEAEAFERILIAVRDASGCPLLPLDRRYERRLAERVTLARQIAKLDAEAARVTGKRSWLEKIASDSGLQTMDADLGMGGGAASESVELAGKATKEARKLRGRLADLLSTPLLPEGVSRRYLTTFAGMPGSLSRGKVGAVPGGAVTSTALLAEEPSREEVVRSHKRPRDKHGASKRARPSEDQEADEDEGLGAGDEDAFLSDDEESLQWSDGEDGEATSAGVSVREDAGSSLAKRGKPAARKPRSGGLVAMPVSAVAALTSK